MTQNWNRAAAAATLCLLATAQAAHGAFINELHYDNTGGDVGEGVEIAGLAGLSLEGWSVLLYNGSNGSVYGSAALGGTIDDEGGGFGALYFEISGMQNGGPDGVALIDAGGKVAQFLSYEGTFAATDGAAAGITSTDIGVSEPADNPAGLSLQLTGHGAVPGQFTWSGPLPASYGSLNAEQTLTAVPLPAALPLLLSALAIAGFRR